MYYFFGLIIIFGFTTYMGILTFITGSKNFSNLNYVKAPITNFRFIKHKYNVRQREKVEDVLVISVEGSIDEFGFVESRNDPYKSIWEVVQPGRIAEIYYDPNSKRIEENVTLHIYDLNIHGFHLVDIKDKKRNNLIASLLLFIASSILLVFIIKIIKRIREKKYFQNNPN